MLTSFRVEKFKAFKDTGEIELKPLTLLSGVNSAGKSSIIQALLLLKQTLEAPPSMALAPGKGRLLGQSLGDNFNDFIFDRPDLENAELVYHIAFAFDSDRDGLLYDDAQNLYEDLELVYPGGILTATFQISFRWGAFGHRGRPTVRVSKLRMMLSLKNSSLVSLIIDPSETGGMYKVDVDRPRTITALQDKDFLSLEIDRLSNFLPDALIMGSQSTLFSPVPVSFLRLFRDCFAAVQRDLSEDIAYLNSFRRPPEQVYSTGQTAGRILEPDGSNVAEVLWQLRDEPVAFVLPDSEADCTLPLAEMTDVVIREVLGLRQAVRVEEVAKDILEVKVQTLGPEPFPVSLADVGLGYNQVLPVIVQGLLTLPGGLVIFEQPEIHLHPDVQARLILFFVGLAKSGRRVLVETHSSHMIEHLCLAIARDPTDRLAEEAQALFVHAPDHQHPSARIESVTITPYGEIINWPLHFLPDVAELDEAIIKAGFAKQKAKQQAER
jgi:predicted ATPase